MMKFLKAFGLGLLYMIFSPVLLAFLAVVALYGIYNFFAELIKASIRFFKGQPFFPPFEEDQKAEAMLNKGLSSLDDEEKAPATVENRGTTNVYVQQNIYQGTPAPQNPQLGMNGQPQLANPEIPGLPKVSIPDIPGIAPSDMQTINQGMPEVPSPTMIEQKEEPVLDVTEEEDIDGQQ